MRVTTFTRDGWVFDVRDTGPLDGDPVVLLHGFPQRASSWDRVAPLLHDAGLRTVAPDQRGYSPGARPRRRRDYAAGELVADVVALIDTLGRPVHLVGHDWGAAVGWATAALRPDLLETFTAVSVPHPGAFLAACVRGDQLRHSWYMAAFQVPRLPERILAGDRGRRWLRGSGLDDDDLDRFHREIVRYGALPGGLGWYRGLLFTRPGVARRRVTVPTTLVWSDRDVALGRAGAVRTRDFVTAPYELVELSGVSHWVPEHAPEELAAAVIRRIHGG